MHFTYNPISPANDILSDTYLRYHNYLRTKTAVVMSCKNCQYLLSWYGSAIYSLLSMDILSVRLQLASSVCFCYTRWCITLVTIIITNDHSIMCCNFFICAKNTRIFLWPIWHGFLLCRQLKMISNFGFPLTRWAEHVVLECWYNVIL